MEKKIVLAADVVHVQNPEELTAGKSIQNVSVEPPLTRVRPFLLAWKGTNKEMSVPEAYVNIDHIALVHETIPTDEFSGMQGINVYSGVGRMLCTTLLTYWEELVSYVPNQVEAVFQFDKNQNKPFGMVDPIHCKAVFDKYAVSGILVGDSSDDEEINGQIHFRAEIVIGKECSPVYILPEQLAKLIGSEAVEGREQREIEAFK